MYKTVRHGENSLQYKILAQQEEGAANVKCRRSRKGRTVGVVTIVLLLVCGVIASAVLVPLILTNDFITLTGTFQKFSVSTLRRAHSGNHVVVIAKKPHGWNSSRQSVLPLLPQASNASLNHSSTKSKENLFNFSSSLSRHIVTHKLSREEATGREYAISNDSTPSATTAKDLGLVGDVAGITRGLSGTPSLQFFGNSLRTTPLADSRVPSTSERKLESTTELPSWQQTTPWSFQSPVSWIPWSKNKILTNPLSIALLAFFTLTLITLLILLLRKKVPHKKKIPDRESADMKEDKARLLKNSSRGSDEE